jgi:hypothetical protein
MKIPAGWKEYADFRSKSVHERAKLLAASGKRNRLDMSASARAGADRTLPVRCIARHGIAPTSKACRFAVDGFAFLTGGTALSIASPRSCQQIRISTFGKSRRSWARLRVHFCDRDRRQIRASTR